MNNKIKKFLNNFSLIMSANLFSLIVATLATIVIPRFFSQETYSYFQLENLYCGYIWISSIGWNDGYYIKYGGINRKSLVQKNISSLLLLTSIYCVIMLIVLIITSRNFIVDSNKKFVFIMASISVSIEIINTSLSNLMQATNSIKQCAIATFIDRLLYSIFVIYLIVINYNDFKLLIFVDILSKIIMFCIYLFLCRDFIFRKLHITKETILQAKEIISIGFFVTIAAYASKLINNIAQFSIEHKWGLLTFGKVAFTLTIANAFTKFVSAVSLVLFPSLRNTNENTRITVYNSLNIFLSVIMLCVFVLYLPMVKLLEFILPNYQESLRYVAVLLPISLFETKVTMLINTYLKVIRHEREILYSNIVAVIISIIFSFLSTYVFENLNMALFSIVIALAVRCFVAEYRLSKYIKIKRTNYDVVVMAISFILSFWFVGGLLGTAIYMVCLIGYFLYNKKNLEEAKNNIQLLAKKR